MEWGVYFVTATFLYAVSCQTYMSTYEAYMNDGGGLCLGDCVNSKCIFLYNTAVASCRLSGNPTLRYRTIQQKLCYSNCGYYNDESYQWCVVATDNDNYSWDYCNRHVAQSAVSTVRADNQYMTCGYTTCGKHNYYNYDWCGTIGTYWEYCNPNNKVLLINYMTLLNTFCASPCEKRSSDGVAYCYDVNYSWTKCFLNPDLAYEMNHLHNILEHNYADGGTFTRHGYKECKTLKIFNKTSAPIPQFKIYPNINLRIPKDVSKTTTAASKALTYHSDLSVQHVASYFADRNPTIMSSNSSENPIVSYTVLPIPNFMYADQINLPLVVHAVITNVTLRANKVLPRPFTQEIMRYMQHMHINHTTDEPDTLIDYRLGGPLESFNMYPQAWVHKNKREYLYNVISSFVKISLPNLHVKVTAVLNYKMSDDKLVHRPTAIMMRVRLYDNDYLVNSFGERLRPGENSMDDMYFSNNPKKMCGYKITP